MTPTVIIQAVQLDIAFIGIFLSTILDVALAKWQRATKKLNSLYLTCVTVRKVPQSLHVGGNLLGARSLENSKK